MKKPPKEEKLFGWWTRALPLYIILFFEGVWMALFFATEVYYLSQGTGSGFGFLRAAMLWLAFHFASPIAVIYALEHVKHKDLGWAPAVWNLQAVFTDLMSTVISFADFPHDLPAPPNQPTAGMQLYQALATWGLILSFFTVVYLLILLFIQRFMDKKPINAINHGGDDEADELIVPPPSSVQRQIHRSVAVTKRLV